MRQATMSSGLMDNQATRLGTEMLDAQLATKLAGQRTAVQGCPRRRAVGACDEPTDRPGGQPVFNARCFANGA
jgi:hypothetical protein